MYLTAPRFGTVHMSFEKEINSLQLVIQQQHGAVPQAQRAIHKSGALKKRKGVSWCGELHKSLCKCAAIV